MPINSQAEQHYPVVLARGGRIRTNREASWSSSLAEMESSGFSERHVSEKKAANV